jgi:DNA adenine methylase
MTLPIHPDVAPEDAATLVETHFQSSFRFGLCAGLAWAIRLAAGRAEHGYIEPFCGGAQVFFHKEPSKVELLNDLNEDIFNFLRVSKMHHEELLRYLDYCIVSRTWFELFQKTPPETLTDIQQAARFFFLQKNCYGGLVVRQNFAASVQDGSNYNPSSLRELMRKTHERLRNVQLECLPYQRILEKYDRPYVFMYLDPPYWNLPYYKFNFKEKDYVELAERLAKLKGKFLLSLNDAHEIRRIFRGFNIKTLEMTYSSQRKAGKRYRELLISNYPLIGS